MMNPAIATFCPVPMAARVEMLAIRECGITLMMTASYATAWILSVTLIIKV